MNWGYRIVFSFIIFIGIIVTMVVISMNQDVNLVADDYYKQEIAYQNQIERMRRTSELDQKPEVLYDRQSGTVTIDVYSSTVETGNVHFFRPSDSQMDRTLAFPKTGEGRIVVPVKGWQTGLWKVKLNWTVGGEDYYTEEVLNL